MAVGRMLVMLGKVVEGRKVHAASRCPMREMTLKSPNLRVDSSAPVAASGANVDSIGCYASSKQASHPVDSKSPLPPV